MKPEQSQTQKLVDVYRMISEARPKQIKQLLKDIASLDGPERHA